MSAAGVPQSYLASQRPNVSTMRDMSMDQNYTNTGNPQGYVPPNFARYTPPMENSPNGKWNTGGLQYSLPTSYGGYASSTPQLPKFNPQGIYNAFANAGRQNQFGGGRGMGNNRNGMPMPQFAQNANAALGQMNASLQPSGQGLGGISAGPAPSNVTDMTKQFLAQQALQAAAKQAAGQVPQPQAPPIPLFAGAGGLSQGAPNGRAFMQGY